MRTRRTDDIQEPDDGGEVTFLGTLRSELDEPVQLQGPYAELADTFAKLRGSYMRGAIGQIDFARGLAALVHTDASGLQWTMGATSGMWFRRKAGETDWRPAPPPTSGEGEGLDLASLDALDTHSVIDGLDEILSRAQDPAPSPIPALPSAAAGVAAAPTIPVPPSPVFDDPVDTAALSEQVPPRPGMPAQEPPAPAAPTGPVPHLEPMGPAHAPGVAAAQHTPDAQAPAPGEPPRGEDPAQPANPPVPTPRSDAYGAVEDEGSEIDIDALNELLADEDLGGYGDI